MNKPLLTHLETSLFFHSTTKKLITRNQILQVVALQISHQPSCMEANGCDLSCHYATRRAYCGSTFLGRARAKVIKINIEYNGFILLIVQ